MLPDIIHWDWSSDYLASMRYDLPLTHTMWKLVEAVEYVDFLKVREQWMAANAP